MSADPRRRFEGRTVLVTGGSRGLGREMAIAFAREGAWVAVAYGQRASDAERALQAIRDAGGDGRTVAMDVTKPTEIQAKIDEVLKARGRIDVAVNNAGIARDAPFALMEPADWEAVLATNLSGPFHVCRALVRPMISAGAGVIINIGAPSSLRASPGQAAYAASKGGLDAFTRTLAAELAPRVRVNAVIPGAIEAGLAARLDRRHADRIRSAIPLGRFGAAREVAAAVLFLASDEASYITGHALVVDGGLTA